MGGKKSGLTPSAIFRLENLQWHLAPLLNHFCPAVRRTGTEFVAFIDCITLFQIKVTQAALPVSYCMVGEADWLPFVIHCDILKTRAISVLASDRTSVLGATRATRTSLGIWLHCPFAEDVVLYELKVRRWARFVEVIRDSDWRPSKL